MGVLGHFVDGQFHYDVYNASMLGSEWALAGGAVLVGLLASAIPARRALKLDISRILSEA